LVLVGRYSGKGDSAGVVEGAVNGANRKFTYEAKFPEESSENSFIPRLWATRRVGYLLDEIRLRGDNPELRDEVTELARKYGIVTPYTAYLILEDEGHRNVPSGLQSFRQLREDQAAYSIAGRAFDGLSREKSGDAAVASALSGAALRQAESPAGGQGGAPEQNRLFLRQYGLAASSAPGPAGSLALGLPGNAPTGAAERVTRYTQQQQFVAGKNFFQNDKLWIDSAVQKQANAKRIRIQFGSPEYFELVAHNASARPWLALGQNVQFAWDGAVYDIYE
jgi:Ca-activated chloride channel homolog